MVFANYEYQNVLSFTHKHVNSRLFPMVVSRDYWKLPGSIVTSFISLIVVKQHSISYLTVYHLPSMTRRFAYPRQYPSPHKISLPTWNLLVFPFRSSHQQQILTILLRLLLLYKYTSTPQYLDTFLCRIH